MHGFNRNNRQVPLRTRSFWWAVNDVFNYVIFREGSKYHSLPPEERRGHIFESAEILRPWILAAFENGWITGKEAPWLRR